MSQVSEGFSSSTLLYRNPRWVFILELHGTPWACDNVSECDVFVFSLPYEPLGTPCPLFATKNRYSLNEETPVQSLLILYMLDTVSLIQSHYFIHSFIHSFILSLSLSLFVPFLFVTSWHYASPATSLFKAVYGFLKAPLACLYKEGPMYSYDCTYVCIYV